MARKALANNAALMVDKYIPVKIETASVAFNVKFLSSTKLYSNCIRYMKTSSEISSESTIILARRRKLLGKRTYDRLDTIKIETLIMELLRSTVEMIETSSNSKVFRRYCAEN